MQQGSNSDKKTPTTGTLLSKCGVKCLQLYVHTVTHLLDITCTLFILFGYTLQLDLCMHSSCSWTGLVYMYVSVEGSYDCVVVLHTTASNSIL